MVTVPDTEVKVNLISFSLPSGIAEKREVDGRQRLLENAKGEVYAL